MIDLPLPPMDSVFADVTDTSGIDAAELDRLFVNTEAAADRLDLAALDLIARRVAAIAERHVGRLRVMHLVRRVDRQLRLRRAQVARQLGQPL